MELFHIKFHPSLVRISSSQYFNMIKLKHFPIKFCLIKTLFVYFRLAPAEQNVITGAMRNIEEVTAVNNARCIQFRPRIASDPYYVDIITGAGCSSTVYTTNMHIIFPISIFSSSGWTEYGWRWTA